MIKLSLLLVTVVGSCASALAAGSSERESAVRVVGETHRDFADPARRNWRGTGSRPLRTTIWYPAATVPVVGGSRGQAEAPLATAPKQFPLILVSHGSGGDAEQVRWLGVALAHAGYIAAAVTHNGTNEEEMKDRLSATDFFAWERPRDLSVVLDDVFADPVLGSRVDRDRIGAAGFSLGGTTVIWLGGARLDLDRLREHSPPPPAFLQASIDRLIDYSISDEIGRASIARSGESYRDSRIRSIFALSPAMGLGFPEASLATIDVPILIVVGEDDVIAPPRDNAARFATHIPGARIVTLPGERGHYTRDVALEQRTAELAEVSALAVEFFDRTLSLP